MAMPDYQYIKQSIDFVRKEQYPYALFKFARIHSGEALDGTYSRYKPTKL